MAAVCYNTLRHNAGSSWKSAYDSTFCGENAASIQLNRYKIIVILLGIRSSDIVTFDLI